MSILPVIRGQCDRCSFSRNLYLNELHGGACDHRDLGCEGTLRRVWTGSKKNIPPELLRAYHACSCQTSLLDSFRDSFRSGRDISKAEYNNEDVLHCQSAPAIMVGARVHALQECGQWSPGVVVKLPSPEVGSDARWVVQCDHHDEGVLTHVASVREEASAKKDAGDAYRGLVEIRNEWRQWHWRYAVITSDRHLQLFFSERDAAPMSDILLTGASVVDKHYKAVGLVSLRSFGLKIELQDESICMSVANETELEIWRRKFQWAAGRNTTPKPSASLGLTSSGGVPGVTRGGSPCSPDTKARPWCSLCHSVFSSGRTRYECNHCHQSVCTACSEDTSRTQTLTTVTSFIGKRPSTSSLDTGSASGARLCQNCLPLLSIGRSPIQDIRKEEPKKPEALHPRMCESYNSIPFSVRSVLAQDTNGTTLSEDDWIIEGYAVLEVKVHQAVGLSGDGKSRPCVQVECQRAYGRTKPRPDTLSPQWVNEPSFRFMLHQPLTDLYLAVVDEDYREIMGAARLHLHSLRPDQTRRGWVMLEIPRDSRKAKRYVDKTTLHEGLLKVNDLPLHRCYWGSSESTRGAVNVEVTLKINHWRREVLACMVPPMLQLAETSALIREEDAELLVTQVYEDVVLILDMVVLTALANLSSFITELMLWHSPKDSLIVLMLSLAIALGIPGSWLLWNPLSIAACITVFIHRQHSYHHENQAALNSMWNFWGHYHGCKTTAEILVIKPERAFSWRGIKRGEPIPTNAIDAGSTRIDGSMRVGRHDGQAGKINMKENAMAKFRAHGFMTHRTEAEILLVEPGARAQWVPISRGDFIPEGAVLAGETQKDGPVYVGRYQNEAGKINTDYNRDEEIQKQKDESGDATKFSGEEENDQPNVGAVQVPAKVRLLIKAFSGLGGDHVVFGSEERKSAARLANIVHHTRIAAVWLTRALGQDLGAGGDADWGLAMILIAGVWIVAFSLLIASIRFWFFFGLACGAALYSPWMKRIVIVGLGVLRYATRCRHSPDGLHLYVPKECISANYFKWARQMGFEVYDEEIFGKLDDELSPERSSRGSLLKKTVVAGFLWFRWLRGPGFEEIFFRFYHNYSWTRAVMERSLIDIPILRQMSRSLLGKANHQVVTYASPFERNLAMVAGAPLRLFKKDKSKKNS